MNVANTSEVIITLINKGQYLAVFILLYLLHYMYVRNLVDKFSVGACRGNPAQCRYNIAKAQANMVRARYGALVDAIHTEYAINLDGINKKQKLLDSNELNLRVGLHKNLLRSCFIIAIEETKRILIENGIPKDPLRLTVFAEEKFNYVWGKTWGQYSDEYSQDFFIVPLKPVVKSEKKREYVAMMAELLRAGVEISEKGGK